MLEVDDTRDLVETWEDVFGSYIEARSSSGDQILRLIESWLGYG